MPIKRLPIPALRPFVALVWVSDNSVAELYGQPTREHVLPSGMMHLVSRLTDCPLRILCSQDDSRVQPVGSSIVGGIRSRFYIRELSAPSCSVGAVLRPGAAGLLFGATADELAERHTPLEDLWDASARSVRERLLEADNVYRLAILESTLAARLPRVRSLHPAIASVIDEMHSLQSVEAAVQQSGISHRQFIAHFRRAVGLAPKTYLRVLRFQRGLQSLRQGKATSLVSLAAEAGYSDQAHFNRDFLEFTGITPMTYQRLLPCEWNHLPVDTRPSRHA
jgi:AraC-like DNA-binding protein